MLSAVTVSLFMMACMTNVMTNAIIYEHARIYIRRRLDKHVYNMIQSPTIDILQSENRNQFPIGSNELCPLFTNYSSPMFSSDFIHDFGIMWVDIVYTPEHFPLTYNSSKPILITPTILHKFYNKICVPNNPHLRPDSSLWGSWILAGFIYFVIL